MARGKKIVIGIVAGVVGLIIVGIGVLALLNRPLSQNEVDEAITARLESAVAGNDSLSSALFTVYSGATGELHEYAVGAPVDSQYHSASVGKTMIATAFGQLVDEGTVSFDDPIARWLDDATLDGLFVVNGVDHSGEVTVRQLLSHTSGAGDYFEGPVTTGATMIEIISTEPDLEFTPHDLLDFTRDHQQPVGRPGEKVTYSDTGYVLLGLALEQIEGKPYADVLDARFFEPLAMSKTYFMTEFGSENGILPVSAAGVDLSTRNALSVDWSGGGVVTTTADLLTFMRALEGGDLVSAQVHDELTDFSQKLDRGIHYGMGIMQFRFSELSPLLFSMPNVHGAIGATGTYALHDPSTDTFYVANYGSLDFAQKAIEELVEIRLILDRLKK